MAGIFSWPNSRAAAIMNPASTVTMTAANRPRGIPASSCQSWNVYQLGIGRAFHVAELAPVEVAALVFDQALPGGTPPGTDQSRSYAQWLGQRPGAGPTGNARSGLPRRPHRGCHISCCKKRSVGWAFPVSSAPSRSGTGHARHRDRSNTNLKLCHWHSLGIRGPRVFLVFIHREHGPAPVHLNGTTCRKPDKPVTDRHPPVYQILLTPSQPAIR
jgi:hypothetical protein